MNDENRHELRVLAGISNQALAAGELPNRLKLLNWGENQTALGPIVVNEQTLAAIEEQRKAKAFSRIVIDFDHQSQHGTPRYLNSPRKHVGYGDLVCLAGDGVYLENVGYTPAGTEFAREYSDISPAVQLFKGTNVVALIPSVALCPNGAVHDLTFFSAEPPEAPSMNDEDTKKLLEQVSGLNEAMKALAEEVKTLKAENASLKQWNDDLQKRVEAQVQTYAGEATATRQAVDRMEREGLIERASREGKVLPLSAEALGTIELPALREMVATAQGGVVPMAARTPAAALDRAGIDGAAAGEIRRMCGVASK